MHRLTTLLAAAAVVVAGCSNPAVRGDGVIKSEDRPVSEFSQVVVVGGYQIKWSAGKPGLNISADQNLLALIDTAVNGDTLRIESKQNLAPTKGITIVLSSAALTGAELTGGVRFEASQLSGKNLKVQSTGASEISLDGSVTDLHATLTGASTLNAKPLSTQTATLSLVGASEAHVTVADTLKVSITGAGSLTYSGNPTSVEKQITGAGSIRHQP